MKLLYYIHGMVVGGAETIVARNILELKIRGIDVVLVTNVHVHSFLERNLIKNGVKIITLFPTSSEGYVARLWRLLFRKFMDLSVVWDKILREEKPDIVHIHTSMTFFNTKYFPYSRIVYTSHSNLKMIYHDLPMNEKKKLIKYAEFGMWFFSLTRNMVKDIRTIFHTNNIFYIPNGLNINDICGQKYDRIVFCKTLGIDTNVFIVGHIARLHPIKNQVKTLKVFRILRQKRKGAVLLFLGREDIAYSRKVRKMAHDMGLDGCVRFLGLRDDAIKIMSVLDAIILPSFAEAMPLVLLEAQAHGVRCVTSMAIPEEIICNDNCFRLPLDASDEIWAEYLLGNFTEQHANSLDEYTMDKVVDRMLVAYEDILAERQPNE